MSIRAQAVDAVKEVAQRMGYEIRARRYYFVDPFEDQVKLLEHCARPLVLLDVGANEGQTIDAYRRVLGEEPVIHAFEPTPELADGLERRYGADRNVKIHRLAVSDRSGTATFHVMGMSVLNSLLEMTPDDTTYRTGATVASELEVATTPLDEFCAAHGVGHVNVLKLDIQGAEIKALTGAERLLSERKVDLLFIEVVFSTMYKGQAYFPEIMELLTRHQYRLYGLYDMAREINGTLGWCNAIFVSQALYARLPGDFWSARAAGP
ncbi:MAG TPA: FkbM family methyltransferase [Polyangiaceae bacterium]|nr:FkbM family methyltransferase [Polyangiaceae bacterium]